MYDIQTILSAYDKQGTLVQWLKNLDETLKNSGLESVNTIPVEGGYKLKFTFANGTVLESDLIEKINTLDITTDSVKLALSNENGVAVEYYTTLTVNNENVESNIKILLPIKGSESVIVDVAENGTAIEIHLDADILSNINRALKTPLENPTSTELVAVDTNGVQKMLTVGDGLKIENDTLSTEVTGGVTTIDIMQTGTSGTLTAEQVALIVDNFPNVNIRWLGQDIFMPLEYTTDNYKFAKVQTSDTQAETKIINVNAPTNTWNFTQYLANLGGSGGGLSWRKVTIDELKGMCTQENIGKLVFINVKPTATLDFFLSGIEPFIAPIGNIRNLQSSSTSKYIGINRMFKTDIYGSNNTINLREYYIEIKNDGFTSYQRAYSNCVIDFDNKSISTSYNYNALVYSVSPDTFDFYIYK